MARENGKWEAEKYALSKYTITFLPQRMPVKDAQGGEIGYTAPKEGIFIAKEHEIFSMLDENEKRFFRKGVFAHELLHQIFTDFRSHERMMKTIAPAEKQIFALMANVLEDPAIEYWAKTKFGGSLMKSLKFSIAHIYEQSPDISESKSAFSQYVNALIQFGDMGLVKGTFTFPEAKDVFLETAPLFNEGILEPNGKKRLQMAKELMEKSRPLWEEEAKEQEKLQKMIEELLKEFGKDAMSGSGSGEVGDSDFLPDKEEDRKKERRTLTLSKLSSSEESSSDDETEGEVSGEKAEETDGKSSDALSSEEEKDASSCSSSSEKMDGSTSPESKDDDIFSDKKLSKEDKKEMEEELESAKEEMDKEKKAEKADTSSLESIDLKCDKITISTSQILNKRATPGDAERYQAIVSEMSIGISNTTRQLRKMLSIAQEETEYSVRGRININRLNCGKNTARVFDRKRTPNDIADLIVGVAVDLSGSMSYGRISEARKCCIALAEVCNNLNIPVYIMGYTGDTNGYRVVHHHYVTWKNSKQDRLSLTNVKAICENYDGPSFRYFAEIMRKKPSKHKLMIVISDGAPSANGYRGESACKDTALAIREARKVCDVLGIAIGNDNTKLLQSFYGNDFMHVSKPSDLFSQLAVKLKKFVRKWTDEV